MGIQLDWQVESDRARQRATEDPSAKEDRRRRRRRVLIGMILVVLLIGGGILAVRWRLQQVESSVRQDLVDTVNVELTALRIGNIHNFMSVQRSASQDWLDGQRHLFDQYQTFKQNGQVDLHYRIVNVTIDDDQPRGRVILEQRIDGITYRMAWFYWRYNDLEGEQNGWRHVPPDVEFWGETNRLEDSSVTVTYRTLDEELAQALLEPLATWWAQGCTHLNCPTSVPSLTVEIVPETLDGPQWSLYDPWTLHIPSPLIFGRTPYDTLPAPATYQAVLDALSRRLVEHRMGLTLQPAPYSDAFWLHGEVVAWLQGQLTGSQQGGSAFVSSLQNHYGPDIPGRLAANLRPNAPLGDLVTLDGLPDEELNALNWTGFFQWRLEAEYQARNAADREAHRALYDTNDGQALSLAQQRFDSHDPSRPVPQVQGVVIGRDALGQRIATVSVQTQPDDPNSQTTVVFRWVEATWKRIS